MSTRYVTLDSLTSAQRRRIGLLLILLGLGLALLVAWRPEQARAPLWVVWLACAIVALAGAVVMFYRADAPRRSQWAVVALLGSMTAMAGWIAVGPGVRRCTANAALAVSGLTCRVAFGAGGVLLAIMLAIALVPVLGGHSRRTE